MRKLFGWDTLLPDPKDHLILLGSLHHSWSEEVPEIFVKLQQIKDVCVNTLVNEAWYLSDLA